MRSPLPFLAARWPRLPRLTVSLAFGLGLASASAQSPAPKQSLLADNGGFEKAAPPSENLWDGVNSDGTLSGFNYSPPVVTEKAILPGLLPRLPWRSWTSTATGSQTSSPPTRTGFFRFYPNVGTMTEPKFTNAELIPIFVSTTFEPRAWAWESGKEEGELQRMCPRFALADWRHSGLLDLMIGNYYGEVLFLPNTGSIRQPVYKVPIVSVTRTPGKDPEAALTASYSAGITTARVQTNDQNRFWGNLFAPAACNWVAKADRTSSWARVLTPPTRFTCSPTSAATAPRNSATPNIRLSFTAMAANNSSRPWVISTAMATPTSSSSDRKGEVGMYLSEGRPDPNMELKRSSTAFFRCKSQSGRRDLTVRRRF